MDIKEKYQLWDEFLQRWPVEKVKNMSLEEYTNLGNNDYFCYWLERKAHELGGIGGGASFKFGIFRTDSPNRKNEAGRRYSKKYGWYEKYGKTEEEAFKTVKSMILNIIEKSSSGKFNEIDSIDLGDAIKWKIAFIYQNRDNPRIVSVYNTKMLAKALGVEYRGSVSELQNYAAKEKPENMDIFEYYNILENRFKESDENDGITMEESEIIDITSEYKKFPLNTILYGPPGTGKTYSVIEKAVEIIDGNISNKSREDLVKRYEDLRENGQIEFITFHQSYSYEDFIEGIKPVLENSDNNSIEYQIEDGIFKTLCLKAKNPTELNEYHISENTPTYKLSLRDSTPESQREGSTNEDIFKYCITNNVVGFGWGDDVDFSTCNSIDEIKKVYVKNKLKDPESGSKMLNTFINALKKDDLIIIGEGLDKFRAIGKIIGDYEYRKDSGIIYHQFREVKWLFVSDEVMPVSKILKKQFTISTIHKISKENLIPENIKDLISNNSKPNENSLEEKNYVLIIDEINRGNISKIFGELITLIEDDKRIGTKNQITTTLPYSKESFGVPKNLYLVGTMNTADRSIALMDTALRRRFHFEELMPDPELLNGITIKGINLKLMLQKLNERVEFLYDRDHEIGHAYFLPLKYIENEDEQFKTLCQIFKNKIIPLLQEYFYDNYEKIQIVLGDHFRQLKETEETENYDDIPVRFIQSKKFKENSVIGFDHEEYEDLITYRINPDLCVGKITPETFKKIYEKI